MYDLSLGVSGFKWDYLILYIILLALALYTGKKLSKVILVKDYWKKSIPLIVTYSLIEGLRYLRGADYQVYCDTYLGRVTKVGYLFSELNDFLNYLGVPFWGAFVVYSLIWIIAVLFFLRPYRKLITLGLPLLLVSHLYYSENLIRQYVAFSFVLISINYILEKKYLKFVALSILSVAIHPISIFFPFTICIVYALKSPVKPSISLSIYISVIVFSMVPVYTVISDIINTSLSNLNIGELEQYAQNSDRWFGEDAIRDKYTKSLISSMGKWVFDVLIIVWGYYCIQSSNQKKNTLILLIYNLFVVGVIGFELFMNIELMRRFFIPLYAFWPVLFVVLYRFELQGEYRFYFNLSKTFCLLYIVSYHIIKNIFLSPFQMFIWDMGNDIGTYHPFL